MAINFPNSPVLNQIYSDEVSGFSFRWNGEVWVSSSPRVSVTEIGIATAGGTVGIAVTLFDFRGPGISTVTVSSGIGTINIKRVLIAQIQKDFLNVLIVRQGEKEQKVRKQNPVQLNEVQTR